MSFRPCFVPSRILLLLIFYAGMSMAAFAQTRPQQINWQDLGNLTAKLNTPIRLRATASSRLPIEFVVLRGPAVVEGDQLIVTQVGSVLVEARQLGSDVYLPAASSIVINPLAALVTPLGSAIAGGEGNWVQTQGRWAFVAAGSEGVKIFDLQDPEMPRRVGEYDTDRFANALEVVGDLVFVADHAGGLVILDVSSPSNPVLVSKLPLPGVATQIRVQGDIAYVAADSAGLLLVDVSQPSLPVRLGGYDSPGRGLGLDVSGPLVYLADGSAGLQVVDVSDPMRPVRVGGRDTPGTARSVRVVDEVAYVSDGDDGLIVLDLSQPSLPRLGGLTGGTASVVAVKGDWLLSPTSGSVRLIDAIRPRNLREVGRYGSSVFAVDLSGDVLTAVTLAGELKVFRLRAGVAQSIIAQNFLELTFTNAPIPLTAWANSGLPVIHSVVSGPARIVDNQLVLNGAGEVNLRVEQAGDAQFLPTTTRISLRVSPNQSVTWESPTNRVLKLNVPHRLRAKASSGLPVDFRVVSGPARLIGDDLIITNSVLEGSVVVAAEQRGSDQYVPVSVRQTFNRPVMDLGFSVSDSKINSIAARVVGSLAYVVDRHGLRIVDIRNPRNLLEVGRLVLPVDPNPFVEGIVGLAVVENRAYVTANEAGLFILDVSDPAHPRLLGQFDTPGRARDVRVVGGTAYVADGASGLLILDVQDPTQPVLLGSMATDFAQTLRVRGSVAYLVDPHSGLNLIDIRQPSQPRRLSVVPITSASDVEIRDDGIAVALGVFGLTTLDVRNPSEPIVLGHAASVFLAESNGSGVHVQGHLAYVVGAFDGVRVIDLSDLSRPELLQTSRTGTDSSHVIQVIDDFAYFASPARGLNIVEVRPLIPQEIEWPKLSTALPLQRPHAYRPDSTSALPVDWRVLSGPAYVHGGELVITNQGTVIVEAEARSTPGYQSARSRRVLNQPGIDITRLSKPSSGPAYPTSLDVVDNLAFVTTERDGLQILDISDPQNFVSVGALAMRNPFAVQVKGGLAYVSEVGGPGRMTIVDVSQPSAPRQVGSFDTPGNVVDISVQSGRAYLADSSGLIIVDVSNPQFPVELGRYSTSSWVRGAAVADSLVYCSIFEEPIQVVDVSRPDRIEPIASWNQYRSTSAVHLANRLAYVANYSRLQLLDVSDPRQPELRGELELLSNIRSLNVSEGWAYCAQNWGVSIVDVSYPEQVTRLADIQLDGEALDVEVSGDLLFVIESNRGLSVFRTRAFLRPSLNSVSFPSLVRTRESLSLPSASPEGFPLSYTVMSGPGRIRGDRLEILRAGTVLLRWETPAAGMFEAAFAEQALIAEDSGSRLEITRDGEVLRLSWLDPAAVIETAEALDGVWTPWREARSPQLIPLADRLRLYRVAPLPR